MEWTCGTNSAPLPFFDFDDATAMTTTGGAAFGEEECFFENFLPSTSSVPIAAAIISETDFALQTRWHIDIRARKLRRVRIVVEKDIVHVGVVSGVP